MTSNLEHRSPDPGFYGWIRSLQTVRSPERWFGGVVSGIADRLEIDRTLARAVFVVACFLTIGVAVLFYGLCWLLLPEPDGRIHLREAGAGRWTAGMTGAVILTVLGAQDLLFATSDRGAWRGPGSVAGAVLIGLFIWMVIARRDRPRQLPSGSAGPAPRTPPAAPAPTVHLAPSRTDWYGSADTTTAPSGSGSTAAQRPAGHAETDPAVPSALHETEDPMSQQTVAPPTVPDPYGEAGHSRPSAPVGPARKPPARALPGSLQAAVVGLALVAAAVVGLLKYLEVYEVPWSLVWVTASATALGVMALGVLFAALRGRTGGGLTVATAILTLPVIASTTGNLIHFDPELRTLQGSPESGYEMRFSTGLIDLSDLTDRELPPGGELTVPIEVDFSTVTILVPDDVDVLLSTDQGFSTITHPTPGSDMTYENANRDLDRQLIVDAPGDTVLHLDTDLAFATVDVQVSQVPTSSTPTEQN